MKRFAFRLDRVARVRVIERDRARGEWAAARHRQAEVQLRLDTVREAARAEAVGQVAGQRLDVRATAFRAGLRAQAVQISTQDLQQAQTVTHETGQVLRDAARRVDALDRLRATKHEEWRIATGRDQAKALDDIATTRAARSSQMGGRP